MLRQAGRQLDRSIRIRRSRLSAPVIADHRQLDRRRGDPSVISPPASGARPTPMWALTDRQNPSGPSTCLSDDTGTPHAARRHLQGRLRSPADGRRPPPAHHRTTSGPARTAGSHPPRYPRTPPQRIHHRRSAPTRRRHGLAGAVASARLPQGSRAHRLRQDGSTGNRSAPGRRAPVAASPRHARIPVPRRLDDGRPNPELRLAALARPASPHPLQPDPSPAAAPAHRPLQRRHALAGSPAHERPHRTRTPAHGRRRQRGHRIGLTRHPGESVAVCGRRVPAG